MVERYPHLKEKVNCSIPGCENLLSPWQNTCQVVNRLLCFGAGMWAFCRKKKERKIKRINMTIPGQNYKHSRSHHFHYSQFNWWSSFTCHVFGYMVAVVVEVWTQNILFLLIGNRTHFRSSWHAKIEFGPQWTNIESSLFNPPQWLQACTQMLTEHEFFVW